MNIQSNLVLEQLVDGKPVGRITITTNQDESVQVHSTGKLPPLKLGQLRSFRKAAEQFVRLSGQDITVERDGSRLLTLRRGRGRNVVSKVNWLAALRTWFRR
ncbi:MAG: hypothetical protein AAFV88_21485 [Planctomycetota bacterium]